jgi:hypothetical protein
MSSHSIWDYARKLLAANTQADPHSLRPPLCRVDCICSQAADSQQANLHVEPCRALVVVQLIRNSKKQPAAQLVADRGNSIAACQ